MQIIRNKSKDAKEGLSIVFQKQKNWQRQGKTQTEIQREERITT